MFIYVILYNLCNVLFSVLVCICNICSIRQTRSQASELNTLNTIYKNYNRFWVVQNSSAILKQLEKLNHNLKAKSISTFDFSTLYTKLPHEIIEVLNSLVEFVFNGGRKGIENTSLWKVVLVFSQEKDMAVKVIVKCKFRWWSTTLFHKLSFLWETLCSTG